jgi:hypothetical protein
MKTINLKGVLETLSDLELKHVVGGEDTSAESPEDEDDCKGSKTCNGSCSIRKPGGGNTTCEYITFSDGSNGCACV